MLDIIKPRNDTVSIIQVINAPYLIVTANDFFFT